MDWFGAKGNGNWEQERAKLTTKGLGYLGKGIGNATRVGCNRRGAALGSLNVPP